MEVLIEERAEKEPEGGVFVEGEDTVGEASGVCEADVVEEGVGEVEKIGGEEGEEDCGDEVHSKSECVPNWEGRR